MYIIGKTMVQNGIQKTQKGFTRRGTGLCRKPQTGVETSHKECCFKTNIKAYSHPTKLLNNISSFKIILNPFKVKKYNF